MANPPPEAPPTGDSKSHPEPSVPARSPGESPDVGTNQHSGFLGFHGFWRRTKKAAQFVAPIAFLIGALWGLWQVIDSVVEKKLSDPTILRKIAAQARPTLVFDGNEAIVSDMGAAEYVSDIRVIKTNIGYAGGMPARIRVEFKKHANNPPILTPLYDSAQVTAERGRWMSWEFELLWNVEPANNDLSKRLFRLELIP